MRVVVIFDIKTPFFDQVPDDALGNVIGWLTWGEKVKPIPTKQMFVPCASPRS